MIAVISGSAGLFGDALHNLSDVSTSLAVFTGFRVSRRAPTDRYPYGYERAEDLVGVALGFRWGDPGAGLAVTVFIGHVGWEVTSEVAHRLMDGIDPQVTSPAEAAAATVAGVIHARARARRTGRTLRVEVEDWVDPDLTTRAADDLGRSVAAAAVEQAVPDIGSFTWTACAA